MSSQENPGTDPGPTQVVGGPAPASHLTTAMLADGALADLSPQAIETIQAAAASSAEDSLALGIRMVTEMLEANRKCFPARLAQGLLQEHLEDPSPAGSTYVVLSRDLLAAGNLEGARWVARRGLTVHPDHRMVATLLTIGDRVSETADEDIAHCREHCPEAPELLWRDCKAADEAGESDGAADLAVRAAVGFVSIEAVERAENAILRVLECEDSAIVGKLVEALPTMTKHKKDREVFDLAMELGGETFEALALHTELADALKIIILKQGDDPSLRAAFVAALSRSLGGERAVRGLMAKTGLSDSEVEFPDALSRYEALALYLPGTHVLNSDWGVGRVTGHDGEFMTIDFKHKPGHRLSLEIAETAIVVIDESLVSVAYYEDPEGIERERDEDPASLVVRAVEQSGGQVTVKELKELLTKEIIPWDDWAAWWRGAKTHLKKDSRVDHTQTFRDMIRLAPDGDEEVIEEQVEVPVLDTKHGLKGAAAMIHRLLNEYPETEERAKLAYTNALALGLPTERSAPARLAVLPFLVRWRPEGRKTWIAEAGRAVAEGGEVTSVTDPADQLAVLQLALESDVWQEAAVVALRSKHTDVVEAAWAALVERGRADLRAALEAELTAGLPAAAAVQLCEVLLSGWEALPADRRPQPWLLLSCLLAIASPASPPKAAEAARAILAGSQSLLDVLKDASSPSRAMTERLRQSVRRGLEEPDAEAVLGTLGRAGHSELVEAIQAEDKAIAVDVSNLPELDEEITLMTRPTKQVLEARLKANRDQLAIVLDDLEQARGFGDLSENSEYETAREQRAMLMSMIESTTRDLGSAEFIEDLKVKEGVARVGTEVVLLEDGDERIIWLLGEGDSHLGDEVVSYRAPLGQALIGHREGDRVTFELNGIVSELEVAKIERRLP